MNAVSTKGMRGPPRLPSQRIGWSGAARFMKRSAPRPLNERTGLRVSIFAMRSQPSAAPSGWLANCGVLRTIGSISAEAALIRSQPAGDGAGGLECFLRPSSAIFRGYSPDRASLSKSRQRTPALSTSKTGEMTLLHRSITAGQRGWKWQPAGGLTGLGISPAMV